MEEPKPPSRMPLALTLVVAAVFILAAILIPFFVTAQDQALQGAGILNVPVNLDRPAPALTLTDLSGRQVSLAGYQGSVVLVNNWATWCPPCVQEMPELQEYYSRHAAVGFVVLAIESGEPAATVQKFVDQHHLTFPVLLDPGGLALEAFKNWNLPSSYLVDRHGTILLGWTGQVGLEALEKYVTPLLEK